MDGRIRNQVRIQSGSDLIKPEHIIPMHGAIGANYQVLMTLIDPGDNMVSVMPTYQQHYSIPESIGAEVRILNTNRQILDDWVKKGVNM